MKSINRFRLAPKKVISNRSTKGFAASILGTVGCGGSGGTIVSTVGD